MGNATSLYNLMRNIDGSVGIATMTTFLARRGQVHQNQMIAHVTPFDPTARNMMYGMRAWCMTHGSNSVGAIKKSMGAMYGMIQQQAALLSFIETFWLMGMIFLGMLPLLVFLRNARDLDRPVKKSEACDSPDRNPVPEPEMAGAFHSSWGDPAVRSVPAEARRQLVKGFALDIPLISGGFLIQREQNSR